MYKNYIIRMGKDTIYSKKNGSVSCNQFPSQSDNITK